MPKFNVLYILIVLSLITAGCAGIEPPSPQRVLRPLSDPPPFHLGDSKELIKDTLGEPDHINQLGGDEVGLIKEEWVYQAKSPKLIDREYMRNDLRLIFTGDTLTSYRSEEPQTAADKK
jgi:hypothetical protein